jgi:hypothetical protein
MKKVLLILLGGIVLLLIFYFVFFAGDGISRNLRRWGIAINLKEFQLQNVYNQKNGGVSREIFEAGSGNVFVRITKIKTDFSKKYIDDKNFLLKSLFLPTTSPYPGVITNAIECPEKFLPKIKKVENGIVYFLFANDRFNYGICVDDLVSYFSAYGIFDCKEKGIFEVNIFSKQENEPKMIIGSFHC